MELFGIHLFQNYLIIFGTLVHNYIEDNVIDYGIHGNPTG